MEVIQSIKIQLPNNTSIKKNINGEIVYKYGDWVLSKMVLYYKFLGKEGRKSFAGGLGFYEVNVGDYMFVTTREANRLSDVDQKGGNRKFIIISDPKFNKLKRYLDKEYEQDLDENSLPIIVPESQSVHNINITLSNSKVLQEDYKKEKSDKSHKKESKNTGDGMNKKETNELLSRLMNSDYKPTSNEKAWMKEQIFMTYRSQFPKFKEMKEYFPSIFKELKINTSIPLLEFYNLLHSPSDHFKKALLHSFLHEVNRNSKSDLYTRAQGMKAKVLPKRPHRQIEVVKCICLIEKK